MFDDFAFEEFEHMWLDECDAGLVEGQLQMEILVSL